MSPPRHLPLLLFGLVAFAGGASGQCNSIPIALDDQVEFFGHPPSFFFADGFETGNTSKWWMTQTSGGGVEP